MYSSHLFCQEKICLITSLRTLWAYGFDSAARRAPEKSKVGEVNRDVSSQLEFSLEINGGLMV